MASSSIAPAVAIVPAPAGAVVIAFAQERELRVWRAGSGAPITVGSAAGPISIVAVDADASRVATVHDKLVTLWDVGAQRALWQVTAGKRPSCLVFHGRRVIFADKFGEVWSIAEAPAADGAAAAGVPAGAEPAFEFGVVSPITAMILSADQKRIVTGDADKRIRVSPFPAAFVIESFCMGSKSAPTALSLDPDGAALFSAGADGVLFAFDPACGAELATLTVEPAAPIRALCALAGSGCALAHGARLLCYALDRRADGGAALRLEGELELPPDVRGAVCALHAAPTGAALWAVCSGGEVLHYVSQPSGGAMRLEGRHAL